MARGRGLHGLSGKARSPRRAERIGPCCDRSQAEGGGYDVDQASGFDARFASAVKLFQSQHFDATGRPLIADGVIGPMTWAALFGAAPVTDAPTGLAGAALGYAVSQVGVMEDPVGSNDGPMVREYLRSTDLGPNHYWCMAFVHWCFMRAAADLNIRNPFPRSAGCLDVWARARRAGVARIVTAAQAVANPSLVKPGAVFILDYGGGYGHTGIVRQSIGGALRTVEGNSNPNGSRNGIGVFDLNRRKVTEPQLRGFLDFV